MMSRENVRYHETYVEKTIFRRDLWGLRYGKRKHKRVM